MGVGRIKKNLELDTNDVVDVINDIAIIRVVMENYFGDNFIDSHTLKRDNNEWKIVAKVFTAF